MLTDPPPREPDPRPAPSGYVTTFHYDARQPPTAGPTTTYVYDSGRLASDDPDGVPGPPGKWYAIYDRNGKVVYSGPTPRPEPPPEADEPPDEPHIVG